MLATSINPPVPRPSVLERLATACVCFGMGLLPIFLLCFLAVLLRTRRHPEHQRPDLPPDEPAPDFRLPDPTPNIRSDKINARDSIRAADPD